MLNQTKEDPFYKGRGLFIRGRGSEMNNPNRLFPVIFLGLAFSLTVIATSGSGVPVLSEDEGPTRNVSHFPKNPEVIKPLPIPQHRDVKRTQPENRWVTYNLATRKETVHESPPADLENLIRDAVKGGETAATTIGTSSAGVEYQAGRQAGDEDAWPANFTDLSLVASPESYPWRVNCLLLVFFSGDTYYPASGVLIDPMHVLTAGHCIHDVLNGGTWATSIVVIPGYANGNSPYGDASAVQLHSWAGWTVDGNFDDDIGVIDLDRPIGALTGWHGYGYNDDAGFYTGNTFHNPSYPRDPPYTGQWMYYRSGPFDFTESLFNVWFGNEVGINRSSYGGQSGSGAYYRDAGGNRTVYAVCSNTSIITTSFPRITSTKFYNIRDDFIAEDTPATLDLTPLDVHTSPSSVPAGGALSSMDYLVHNYSAASWSGTVNVDVYISSNNNISTLDTLIQSHSFSWSFAPKSSVRVSVTSPPIIPSDQYAGSYYIGVILNISDYSTANNDSDGQDASAITVSAVAPLVTTASVTSIGATSAVCGGTVSSEGGASVTARGVCWSVSPDPTINAAHTTDGSGPGSFTSNLTGLTPGTKYYVRAYAANNVGTSYGAGREFTTQINLAPPTVTTNPVTSIGATSAVGGGNVISDGGAAVTARGVCWGTAANPTTSNSHTHDGTGTGTFASSLSGLAPETTYHVRAYAANSVDTAYGSDVAFSTPGGAWAASRRLTWTSGASADPAIAAGTSADLHLVWSDATPGHEEIYYKRSIDGGASWAAAARLTWSTSGAGFPAMAVDSSGSPHIVWQESTPGNAEIYYKRSANGGATWKTSQRLTWTSGQSSNPAMAVAPSGSLHVVWEDDTPGNVEIYYKGSTDGGVTWTAGQRLTWTSGGSHYPAIAVDPAGVIHVVWEDDTPGNREIYFKKSGDGGAAWTTAKRLTWSSGQSGLPAEAIDSSGHIHGFWEDSTPGNNEIYYKKSTDGGVSWTAVKRISLTSGDSQYPDSAVDLSGHIHVVWEDLTPENWEIYYNKSKDGGATWTAKERLSWTGGDSRHPAIAPDSFGNLHVVWLDSTPGNSEIYYREFVKQY
jgi:V8-like Glu-specific endopeptidase